MPGLEDLDVEAVFARVLEIRIETQRRENAERLRHKYGWK